MPPVWGRITNLVVDHGEGSWLITTDGERYLDYSSGIGVTNTGPRPSRGSSAAIQAQAAKLLHGQQNIVYHEPGLRLYERLSRLLPGGPWGAFLSNSGAEAVEAAVKLARVATGRPAIIAFRYGFHGRTGQTMALTDGQGRLPRRVRATAGLRLPRGLPVLLPRDRRPARSRRRAPATGRRSSTCCSTSSSTPTRSRRSSSSPSSARAATSSRRRPSCPGCARSPASTASCSSRTRSRRASGGPASCSPSSTGTSSPTSSSSPRASRRACRSRGSIAKRELLDKLRAGHPWRDVRRQRRRLRRRAGHARRDRGRRARRQRPRARTAVPRRPAADRRGTSDDRRRPRARADARARVRQARRGRRPRPGSRPSPSACSRRPSRASCWCSRRART